MKELQISKFLIHDQDPVFFDVGANDGNFTLEILSLFPDSLVYAFEPDSDCRIFQLEDDRIKSFNCALSNDCVDKNLYKPHNNRSHNSFHVRPHFLDLTYTTASSVCATVDKFVRENKINKISYLKIDTEGHELEVLIGAQQSFEEKLIKAGQFEYGGTWKEKRAKFSDAFDFLTPLDYEIYDLESSGTKPITRNFQDTWSYKNFYFAIRNS